MFFQSGRMLSTFSKWDCSKPNDAYKELGHEGPYPHAPILIYLMTWMPQFSMNFNEIPMKFIDYSVCTHALQS